VVVTSLVMVDVPQWLLRTT